MLIPRVKKPRERSRYWLFLFFFSLERNQGASGTPTSRRHKRTLTESRCWYTIHGTEEGRRTVREMHAYRYRFSMKRKLETHRGISSIKRDDEYGNRIYRIPSPPFILSPFFFSFSSFVLFEPPTNHSRERSPNGLRAVISRDKLSPL